MLLPVMSHRCTICRVKALHKDTFLYAFRIFQISRQKRSRAEFSFGFHPAHLRDLSNATNRLEIGWVQLELCLDKVCPPVIVTISVPLRGLPKIIFSWRTYELSCSICMYCVYLRYFYNFLSVFECLLWVCIVFYICSILRNSFAHIVPLYASFLAVPVGELL